MYTKQFPDVDVSKLPKCDLDDYELPENTIDIAVTEEMVLSALKKCKPNSAPGPSGIT